MNEYQRLVRDFHEAVGATVGETPEIRDHELRAKLILEEAVETVGAMGFAVEARLYPRYEDDPAKRAEHGDPLDTQNLPYIWAHEQETPDEVEVIDGLCDLLYVTFGTAVAAGIDLDAFFHEVHATNMAKLAGEKRADGKQLKPEGWRPPQIAVLLQQLRDRVILPNVHLEAIDTQV